MARIITLLMVGFMLGRAFGCHAQVPLVISDDWLVIEGFEITGNKVTKESIILRELVFAKGDTVKKMELIPAFQQSRLNLLNTSLFNFVSFDAEHLPGNRIIVQISVTERWYIWPVPILEYAERNFSEFIKNREWDKLVYGAYLKWNNFRGRKELLTGKIRLGYINEYALSYYVPNLGKKQQHEISTGFNINHQNEVNVSTVKNQPVEYKPLVYPAQIRINAFARYSFRRKLYSTHTLRMEYTNYWVSDSIVKVNPNYLGYSGGNAQVGEPLSNLGFFLLNYEFRYDVRDSKIYPLNGFAVKLKAEKLGLGIIPDFPYSSVNFTGVLMFHQELARRVFFYNTTKGRYSSGKLKPHILNQGLGYNEWLSAYEPYVMDGSDYFISKYNLKIQVVKPKTNTLPFIKMEQFNKVHYAVYANIFADVGYVNNEFPNPTNTMVNNWQFSTGVGVDFVTYYDQVLRIDYAINRYGEHGVFFHLETPFYRW
jgi:outer membrane protein assembly factor BamA